MNIDELWNKYATLYKNILLNGDTLMAKKSFTEAIGEIISLPVEPPVMQLGHGKKYNIIYADPPWYRGQRMYSSNKNDQHVEADRHYPVMKKEALCALPIKQIADDDCALFMWVTDSNLDEAMDVIKAWGFKYKTVAFIWLKKEKSGKQVCFMGCWTMKNAEIVLLATRGAMTKYLKSRKVRQLQEAIRERNIHSRKPQIIRDRIVEMFGEKLPKIELFARQRVDGWDAWGNEVPQSA